MTDPSPPVARLESELNEAIRELDTLLMDPAATSQQIAAAETAASEAYDAYWPATTAGQAVTAAPDRTEAGFDPMSVPAVREASAESEAAQAEWGRLREVFYSGDMDHPDLQAAVDAKFAAENAGERLIAAWVAARIEAGLDEPGTDAEAEAEL